jgi:hypothetical protein
MFLKPESLLACVEAMDIEQLGRLCIALAKVNGIHKLRELYAREAQAAIVRGITPDLLLACVERMTEEQKLRLCELFDPVPEEAIEAEFNFHDHIQKELWKRAPTDGRDPSMDWGEFALVGAYPPEPIPAEMPIRMARPAVEEIDPDVIADAFNEQYRVEIPEKDKIVALRKYGPEPVHPKNIVQKMTVTGGEPGPVGTVSDFERPTDFACLGPEEQTRWLKARDRWNQLFGEAQIPMVVDEPSISIGLIEGMIYDKQTKNLDPLRCTCGCGSVVGCLNPARSKR